MYKTKINVLIKKKTKSIFDTPTDGRFLRILNIRDKHNILWIFACVRKKFSEIEEIMSEED